MTRTALGAFLTGSLLLPVAAQAQEPFAFAAPEGFTSLERGSPDFETKIREIREELTRQGLASLADMFEENAQRVSFLAFDLTEAQDGFLENMNAVVGEGALPMTEETVERIETESRRQAEEAGVRYEPLSRRIERIGGVACARIEARITVADVGNRSLIYYVPGGDDHAVLTYSASPDDYERYLPLFEASAAATRGAQEPPDRRAEAIGRAVGIAVGVGLSLFVLARVRKARAAQGGAPNG